MLAPPTFQITVKIVMKMLPKCLRFLLGLNRLNGLRSAAQCLPAGWAKRFAAS